MTEQEQLDILIGLAIDAQSKKDISILEKSPLARELFTTSKIKFFKKKVGLFLMIQTVVGLFVTGCLFIFAKEQVNTLTLILLYIVPIQLFLLHQKIIRIWRERNT